jgi:putative ABC transport system permease protein
LPSPPSPRSAFFTDRVQRALQQQANRLLGADLAVSDSRAIAPELKDEARRRGLTAVTVVRFPSMVVRGERTMLSDVKVVEAGFPARGDVRIAERLFGPDRRAASVPEPGTVWVDERLYTGLELGEDARVSVGRPRAAGSRRSSRRSRVWRSAS